MGIRLEKMKLNNQEVGELKPEQMDSLLRVVGTDKDVKPVVPSVFTLTLS